MADLSASETRTEFEQQKGVVSELQNRLADAELQIIEGENLRKKLHNTILVRFLHFTTWHKDSLSLNISFLQELKGNIRVFCRVRPLLPEDDAGSESSVISFPTSTEALGRGIDLTQNGKESTVTICSKLNRQSHYRF